MSVLKDSLRSRSVDKHDLHMYESSHSVWNCKQAQSINIRMSGGFQLFNSSNKAVP